ncbi:hypothetical protein ACTFIY_008863 [Dictyostelium cf. discoideum]
MSSTINNTPPKEAIRRAKSLPPPNTIRPTEVDDMYTTESTDESDVQVREKEPNKSKTLVSIKTDYEAANIKVVDAITNRNCQSTQDYLRSILDSNILALLKMVVPDWLQTDVSSKLNTQTECREAITELVLNNADKFSRKRSSDSLSNNGEKFPTKKNHAVPNYTLITGFLVYRYTKGYCLNCGHSNHKTSNCRLDPVDSKVDPSGDESKSKLLNKNYKISQYHHLEDYDFSVNKDSLYTLNSFYNQNIVTQLHQQNQQHDVHNNINKLKETSKTLMV